jgi:hypothetical protein
MEDENNKLNECEIKKNISISNLKIRNHMRERERERERVRERKREREGERVEDADIILKCILKKCFLRMVAELKWLRTKTSEGIIL